MSDVLNRICADKRELVAELKRETPLEDLRQMADESSAPRGFRQAILDCTDKPAIIAEIKQASPSKGVLRDHYDPAMHAAEYESAGATCLSVLTDAPYFKGEDRHLMDARAASTLPVLRKDFILDPWQVFQSRAVCADAVLLIMAAVGDRLAQDIYDTARGLDMNVLIEVHDMAELERALNLHVADDTMIGVNNRNLQTLEVSLQTSLDLIREIPDGYTAISESGIRTGADLRMLAVAGFRGFLVGEALMTQPHPGEALLTLMAEQS